MEEMYIETAQNIQIRQSPATIGVRILAQIIDFLIVGVYLILVSIVAYGILDNKPNSIALSTILVLPYLVYHLLFEIFMNGQSIGKYALDIRVVQVDGSKATIGSYILRWILRPIDILISFGGLAVLSVLLGGKGQRLGDMAAGTTVISLKQTAIKMSDLLLDIDVNHEPKFPQVVNLNDSQIVQIKAIRAEALKSHDYIMIKNLAEKTSTILQVSYSTKPLEFINQLVLDYEYFAQKEYGEA